MDLQKTLQTFGLDRREAEVYLLLLKHNWITALNLSRLANIKRPTLYRILERLQDKGLVEVKLEEKTSFYNAANPNQLETIINNEQSRINKLKSDFTEITSRLTMISDKKIKETSIHFYRGKKSLQYLEMKKSKYKNQKWLIFDPGNFWFNYLGHDFAENIRQNCVDNNIAVYELQNQQNIKKLRQINWTNNQIYLQKYFSHRQINTKILNITQNIELINNYIYMITYTADDRIGIEIESESFYIMMRQLFISIWNRAKVIDKFGGKNL